MARVAAALTSVAANRAKVAATEEAEPPAPAAEAPSPEPEPEPEPAGERVSLA